MLKLSNTILYIYKMRDHKMSMEKSNKNFIFTLIATTLFISTYYLLMPVLPLHMKMMGGTKFYIGLIMGLFSVSSLFFRPAAGRASDRKGPTKIMRLSICIFFLTPFFYIVNSFSLISLVQLVYGFTIGAFTISSATIITVSVSKEFLSQAIGIHSIALILAKGLSPTLGTIIYKAWGLHPLLALTVLQAILALLCTFKVDYVPPLNKDISIPFSKVITHRMVWVPSIVLLTVTLTFGTIMTMLPLMALERNIPNYSWFFTVNTLAVVATRLFTGKQSKLSLEGIIALSLIALFIGVGLIANVQDLSLLVIAAFIYGLGYGAVYPALSTIVVLNTPSEIRGSAFGLFTSFFDIGVTFGSVWGGFSEYLGFNIIYMLASLVPVLGLVSFVYFLRNDNIWDKIRGHQV